MVTLNTNDITIPILPKLNNSRFSLEPDWIGTRDEVTDSYKRFYSLVMRRIGNKGFSFLSIERLAQDLKLSTRTISNHIATSRKFNLMQITRTSGRSSLFVILWHEWMPITKDQAEEARSQFCLSEKISNLISKSCKRKSPDNQTNQQVSDNQKNVESSLKEPIKEIRGHVPASTPDIAPTSTTELATSNTTPDTATTATTTDNSTTDNQKPVLKTEVTPAKVLSNKGKHSLQVYLDFARSEQAQKKNIKNVDNFAEWLLVEGKQDKEVAKFVAIQKENLIGARASKQETPPSSSPTATPGATATRQEALEVQRLLAIESLGEKAWTSLSDCEQVILLKTTKENLSKTIPTWNRWRLEGQEKHALGVIKERLGEWAYSLNLSDCGGILERIGKELFEGMEDWEKADLQDAYLERLGEKFYSMSVAKQRETMQKTQQEIYLEIALLDLGKV